MWKWIVGALACALLAFLGVVAWRTATFAPSLSVAEVALAEPPAIDADRAAARLAAAIRIPTISRDAGVVEDPAAFAALHDFLAESYPLTHAAMRREIVVGHTLMFTLEGADPALKPLMLLAHQDVVPVEEGTEGAWPAPPFSGDIVDGFVVGRGAADDKGSLIAILEATEALFAEGFRPRRTLILGFGHDEETGGLGAQAMARLLTERDQKPWMVVDEGMAIIEDFPLTGEPVALIGVAEKGYMSVRVTARATGGHSSTPPPDSAAERLSRAIVALRERPFPASLEDGPAPVLLETLAPRLGLLERVVIANRWAFGALLEAQLAADSASDALLRTTIAPTIVHGGTKENVLPQEMHAIVNLRLHPRDTRESALAWLRESVKDIEGVTIEIEGDANEPSPVSRMDSESYALLASAARAASPPGAAVAPMLVLGGTDSRYFAGVAENVYRFAGWVAARDDLSRIHGDGERMSVDNMGRLSRFYAQLIETGAR